MEAIVAEAGSCYLNEEQNREYMKLSTRVTQLAHDVWGKRALANHVMRDRVWPELVPRALRYWKLVDKPCEQLTDAEAEELKGLLEWIDKLRAEAIETAEKELAKTSGTSGGESENCQ
jgi:predicted house-cleaning noncanonical NTP pyrophosphatase (MazG superfamily)